MYNKFDIIGMCHLMALPGDPNYQNNMDKTIERAKKEIEILQKNGITKILFSNEFSYPYTDNVSIISTLSMAYIVGVLKKELSVPFGVDCMYDPYSTINMATAIKSDFYRITLSKLNVDDLILGKADINKIVRYADSLKNISNPDLFLNISIPFRKIVNKEDEAVMISSIITQINPFAICLSSDNDFNSLLHNLSSAKTLIICDGGCNEKNLINISKHANGAIIGKALKKNEQLCNQIDEERTNAILRLLKYNL